MDAIPDDLFNHDIAPASKTAGAIMFKVLSQVRPEDRKDVLAYVSMLAFRDHPTCRKARKTVGMED